MSGRQDQSQRRSKRRLRICWKWDDDDWEQKSGVLRTRENLSINRQPLLLGLEGLEQESRRRAKSSFNGEHGL